MTAPPVAWATLTQAPPFPVAVAPVFDPLVDDPEADALPPEEGAEAEANGLGGPEPGEPEPPEALPQGLGDADARREAALMTRLRDAFARANGVIAHLDPDGRAALEQLVVASERLVRSIAGRYANQGVPKDDLYQEGVIGLFRAARKFDVDLGFRFSTYAMWWIRQAIIQAVHEQGRLIRIPVHAVDQLARTNRVRQELERRGQPATAEAVAAVLEMRPAQVTALWRAARQHVSIEGGRGHRFPDDGDDGDLADVLLAPAPGPDELVQRDLQALAVGGTLFALSPRERRILRLRFGLEDGQVYSLSVVGLQFGLSRERIRQIEADALEKLRAVHLSRRLRPYLG